MARTCLCSVWLAFADPPRPQVATSERMSVAAALSFRKQALTFLLSHRTEPRWVLEQLPEQQADAHGVQALKKADGQKKVKESGSSLAARQEADAAVMRLKAVRTIRFRPSCDVELTRAPSRSSPQRRSSPRRQLSRAEGHRLWSRGGSSTRSRTFDGSLDGSNPTLHTNQRRSGLRGSPCVPSYLLLAFNFCCPRAHPASGIRS
jgi:hypothetical protein